MLFHVRRFGPLILYATETLESYNFIIRLRSIHSSRHAPSLDIGRAFAHLHAVRHLISGGYVCRDVDGSSINPRQAGLAVQMLTRDKKLVELMGMAGVLYGDADIGTCVGILLQVQRKSLTQFYNYQDDFFQLNMRPGRLGKIRQQQRHLQRLSSRCPMSSRSMAWFWVGVW